MLTLRILGCGTSSGVPRIGNDWGACDPAEPLNRRTRVSILVETPQTRVLVDTSPDLREQLLRADVAGIDAVIWTHDHADHCHGIDDLRQIFHHRREPLRGLARELTLQTLQTRFGYVFDGRSGYPAIVRAEALPDTLVIGDLAIAVVDQPHGDITSAGLRFTFNGKSLVYATDTNSLTSDMLDTYRDADIFLVGALRRAEHPTHASLSDALAWGEAVGARRTVLTHMDQSMDYRQLVAELPAGVEPGYDGMEIAL